MIDVNATLGQLATTHPAATRVFLRHRLDFCCGGRQKLGDACQESGLDPEVLIAEISAADVTPPTERWDAKPPSALVEFILTHYHEPLRRDLPALVAAAHKVERVHRDKPGCPHGLAAYLERFQTETLQHLAKEEQVLFPAIQAGRGGAPLYMPVRVLMEEHDDHGANLRKLRTLAGDFVCPSEACATWRALYSGLAALEAELMEHIHLENNVLFPRVLNG